MIEVEVRGELTKEQYEALKRLLTERGKHVRTQDREMILLRGYPGYSKDPTVRDRDIRIRKTNGQCEFMLKYKVGGKTLARREVSLPLQGDVFEAAKEIAVGFGATTGIWMHRISEVYECDGVEWSVAEALKRDRSHVIYYYEAEIAAGDETEIPNVREKLIDAASDLNVPVITTDDGMRELLYRMDATVNEELNLAEAVRG